jgi:hypothetical protein
MMSFINIYMKEMKNERLHIVSKTIYRKIIYILFMTTALIAIDTATIAQATNDSGSKLSFTVNLRPIMSNGVRSVRVLTTRKENKKAVIVDDIKSPFNLYLNEVKDYDGTKGTGWMSSAFINNEGEGIFIFPGWFNKLPDSIHEYTFIVKMNADPKYEDVEEETTVADARISLNYAGEDSVKTIAASLSGWKEQAYVPIPTAELKLCIKRTFNFLPVGEAGATTDENGEITGELPLDIPGNANGTITLAARLEDDDKYGTVEVTKDVPWAVLPKVNPPRGRTLWSPGDNAPLLLVISSVTIIVIIWGTILYLVSLLFKIKKLGNT